MVFRAFHQRVGQGDGVVVAEGENDLVGGGGHVVAHIERELAALVDEALVGAEVGRGRFGLGLPVNAKLLMVFSPVCEAMPSAASTSGSVGLLKNSL